MALRNRSRYEYHTGYTGSSFPPSSTVTKESRSETCEDFTDMGKDNNPFLVNRIERVGGLVSGRRGSSAAGYVYYADAPVTEVWNISPPSVGLTTQTNSYYAAKALERTNPSRPSISALVNAIELREIPGLIKDTYSYRLSQLMREKAFRGWKFLSRAAKLNLMIQFGILPLYGDISKLPEFMSSVDDRLKEVDRLRTRGLRRSIDVDADSGISVIPNRIWFSASGTSNISRVDRTTISTVKVRAHVRWHTTFAFPKSDAELRARTIRAVAGLDVTPSAVYELIPWSWLVDYFTNLGSIVGAISNTIPAYHVPVQIMRHTRNMTTWSNPRHGNTLLKMTEGYALSETKTRSTSSPSLSASMGFLTGSQMSILGSLSVLKR